MASEPDYTAFTGEELGVLAYAQPPIKPTGLGPTIVALVWIMSILTTTVVCLRIWARTFYLDNGQKWGIEDYLCVIGYVRRSDPAMGNPILAKTRMLTFHEPTQLPFVPAGALGIMGAKYGLGARDDEVNLLLKIRAREYALLYEMVYYASSTITKVAIAATILRICVKKRYKYIIWADMIM